MLRHDLRVSPPVLTVATSIILALFVVTRVSDRIFFGGTIVAASLALVSLLGLLT